MTHTKSRRGVASFTAVVTLIAAGALMLLNKSPNPQDLKDQDEMRDVTYTVNWEYDQGGRIEWGPGFPPPNKVDVDKVPFQRTERVAPGTTVTLRATLTSDNRNDFLMCAITANNQVHDATEPKQYLGPDRHVCLVRAKVN